MFQIKAEVAEKLSYLQKEHVELQTSSSQLSKDKVSYHHSKYMVCLLSTF